jgi:hypothetical protein
MGIMVLEQQGTRHTVLIEPSLATLDLHLKFWFFGHRGSWFSLGGSLHPHRCDHHSNSIRNRFSPINTPATSTYLILNSMDLSALLGGGEQGDLNEDFAGRDPSGKTIFSKVFGASTAYETKEGAGRIRVSFFFDPHEIYSETATLASMNPDFFAVVREELTKHLLEEEDMVPRTPTVEELTWSVLKKNLPEKAFQMCFSPADLQPYITLLRTRAEATHREERKLSAALQTRDFSFVYKIAIDAYRNKHQRAAHDRRGVLTMRVEGGSFARKALGLVEEMDLRASQSDASTLKVPAAGDKKKKVGNGGRPRTPSQVRRDDMMELADLMVSICVGGCVLSLRFVFLLRVCVCGWVFVCLFS